MLSSTSYNDLWQNWQLGPDIMKEIVRWLKLIVKIYFAKLLF